MLTKDSGIVYYAGKSVGTAHGVNVATEEVTGITLHAEFFELGCWEHKDPTKYHDNMIGVVFELLIPVTEENGTKLKYIEKYNMQIVHVPCHYDGGKRCVLAFDRTGPVKVALGDKKIIETFP